MCAGARAGPARQRGGERGHPHAPPAAGAPAPPAAPPPPPPGGGGPPPARHSTAGRVVFRNSDRIRDRYQFLVPDEAERALAPVVNARGAVRVHLDEDHAGQVVLRVREREEEETKEIEPTIARLVDLSGLGLSVLVDS